MPKYGKKPPKEIAEKGKQDIVAAFIKTRKTTKNVQSKTSRAAADNN